MRAREFKEELDSLIRTYGDEIEVIVYVSSDDAEHECPATISFGEDNNDGEPALVVEPE